MSKTIIEPEREIPIVHHTDVLVLGGGPAGVGAAVSAARCGVDVTLIERYGFLGGLSTGGLVIALIHMTDGVHPIVGGLCQEFVNRLETMGAIKSWDSVATSLDKTKTRSPSYIFDAELFQCLMHQIAREARVHLQFHTWAVGAVVADHHLQAVIVESKAGRQAISAQVFVDASGDADMAKWCGVPFEKNEPAQCQSVGLPFRIGGVDIERASQFCAEARGDSGRPTPHYQRVADQVAAASRTDPNDQGVPIWWIEGVHPGEVWVDIINLPGLDPLAPQELTEAEIRGRERILNTLAAYRRYVPGFESAYLIEVAPHIGVRESRRIIGSYRLTCQDLEEGRSFHDSIGRGWNGPLAKKAGGQGAASGYSFPIPYRCLVPRQMDNLLFAGRCISVESTALEYVRMIPQCIVTGEAAGVAAALAVQQNIPPDQLDVTQIQAILRDRGAIL